MLGCKHYSSVAHRAWIYQSYCSLLKLHSLYLNYILEYVHNSLTKFASSACSATWRVKQFSLRPSFTVVLHASSLLSCSVCLSVTKVKFISHSPIPLFFFVVFRWSYVNTWSTPHCPYGLQRYCNAWSLCATLREHAEIRKKRMKRNTSKVLSVSVSNEEP